MSDPVVELDLFPPYSDRDTSLAAAHAIEPHAGRLQQIVLDAIRNAGELGMCNHELEELLDLSGNTVRPRVVELRRAGLVERSEIYRKTPSGRMAIAWRIRRQGGQ